MKTLTMLIDGETLIELPIDGMYPLRQDQVGDVNAERDRLALTIEGVLFGVRNGRFDEWIGVLVSGDQP